MSAPSNDIRSRGDTFAPHLETQITEETPHATNPYLVENVRIHGYDHLELMAKLPFTDVLFLLLRGELPTLEHADIFRRLSVALINPGPRHPAGQAAIVAGVGKTDMEQLLPIALAIYGGKEDGAGSLDETMQRMQAQVASSPPIQPSKIPDSALGFGTLYGDKDPYAAKLLGEFKPEIGPHTQWAHEQQLRLEPQGAGILRAGVCAAVLLDLGFVPRQGVGLMQLFGAPGLLAHGIEFAGKPLTQMLFEPDSHYDLETDR